MFRTTLGLFICLFVVCACAQDSGTFTGKIISRAGTPIEGATVTFPNFGDGKPLGQATTDRQGSFVLQVQEPDGFEIHRCSNALRIEADGYAATYVDERHLTLFPGSNKDLGNIVLETGRTYSGKVINEKGQPAVGAKVVCANYRHYLAQTILMIGREMTVTTDSNGCFETPPLTLGTAEVRVQADGYLLKYYDPDDFRHVGIDGLLPDLILAADKPIHGIVRTELGDPIADARIEAYPGDVVAVSDAHGEFVLRGFGDKSRLQLHILEKGYVFVKLSVAVEADGVTYYDVGDVSLRANGDPEAYKKAKEELSVHASELDIVLRREGQIRGQIVDAETVEPITASRIVICSITRKPDGEIVLDGCRDARFQQPRPGEFVVGYSYPGEYHLAVSAEGYSDAEGFTPLVTALDQIDDIVIKMSKTDSSVDAEHKLTRQQINGVVLSQDVSSEPAMVALWRRGNYGTVQSAYITRGRTTVGDGTVSGSTSVKDGRFSLDVPYQGDKWYVLVETPSRIVAIQGPIDIAKGETKSVELVPKVAGGLQGRVSNFSSVPVPLHAILFSDVGILYETPVQSDGRFEFADVFPGEYGLKIGSDSILDSEIPGVTNAKLSIDEQRKRSDPWKRAKRVIIEEAIALEGIEIAFEQ